MGSIAWDPPLVLPASWLPTESPLAGVSWAWVSKSLGLRVLATVDEIEGTRFLHLSVSRRSRLPTWSDLRLVKRLFLGPERQAIQVLPRESEYVNVHPYCLHLWSNLSQPDWAGLHSGNGPIMRQENGV